MAYIHYTYVHEMHMYAHMCVCVRVIAEVYAYLIHIIFINIYVTFIYTHVAMPVYIRLIVIKQFCGLNGTNCKKVKVNNVTS